MVNTHANGNHPGLSTSILWPTTSSTGRSRPSAVLSGSNPVQIRNDLYRYLCLHLRIEIFIPNLRNGLADVIGLDWLRMFSSRELSILISGSEQDIGMDDLMVIRCHYSLDLDLLKKKAFALV